MAMTRAFAVLGSRVAAQAPRCAASARRPAFGATAVLGRRWMSEHFLESHEFIKFENGVGTVGITDFAQQALGDVVYVELPDVGATYEKGDSFGSVESVKAASDVYAPVGGEVIEVNEKLSDEPGLVNSSPMKDGWFMKIKVSDPAELKGLLGPDAYKKHCDDSKH